MKPISGKEHLETGGPSRRIKISVHGERKACVLMESRAGLCVGSPEVKGSGIGLKGHGREPLEEAEGSLVIIVLLAQAVRTTRAPTARYRRLVKRYRTRHFSFILSPLG